MPVTSKIASFFRSVGAISFGVLISASLSPASAQVNVPTSVDPSNVEKRFDRPEPSLPQTRMQSVTPAAPQISPEVRAQLEKKSFVLREVLIEGATVFSQDRLKSTYDDVLGKQITLLDAQSIVQRITDLYHRNEYVLSQAVLPPQNIQNGVLRIRVVEGYIHNVIIEGELKESGYSNLVASYGKELSSKRPVSTSDLERYLLLMDDLPGATARGLVRPSPTQFGAADLVVTLSHQTYEASYTLDNRGTKYIGPWQHTGIFAANSIFGMYDRTVLRLITTSPIDELRFIDLQHEQQVGSEGTRLVFTGSHSMTRPNDALKPIDIRGRSTFLQVKAYHPFVRSRQENLIGRAMIDTRDTDTNVFKNQDFTHDRLRVVRAGGSYDFADWLYGVNLFDAQISQGLNIANASRSIDSVSNTLADGTFTKVNLDVTRTQPLPSNFSIFTAASAQYAFDPLLAAEQYTLGGIGFGQAYDPAELAGDHGLAGKIELRYGQALQDYYLQSYQVYSYYDIGRVWIRDAGPGMNDKKSLASAGVGVRTNFSDKLSGNLEVGLPLTKPVNNQGGHDESPRLFFSVTGRF